MKLTIEVKEDKKVTTYTADLTKAGEAVGGVADKVGKFLKDTFKKEVFIKEEK
jgi:hypothetical protein